MHADEYAHRRADAHVARSLHCAAELLRVGRLASSSAIQAPHTFARHARAHAPQEEIKDLLLPASPGAARPGITIRETQAGGVGLYGNVEKEVRTRDELATVLEVRPRPHPSRRQQQQQLLQLRHPQERSCYLYFLAARTP